MNLDTTLAFYQTLNHVEDSTSSWIYNLCMGNTTATYQSARAAHKQPFYRSKTPQLDLIWLADLLYDNECGIESAASVDRHVESYCI